MGPLRTLNPAALPPGTEVGPWRVVSLRGVGVYGAVYRVERVGREGDGPFALKLALYPRDPRFEREAELLSRIRSPHVPRLEARGRWELPGEVFIPYMVMEWVEGLALYEWAAQRQLTSREVLEALAQVARALAATHAVEGVHRDVKGANVLVTREGRVVLVDFGSAWFRGASTVTRQQPPPGTPQYQSPECQRFQLQPLPHPTARYEAQPADDVYALGMMGYRLATGGYPPPLVDMEETEEGLRLIHPPLVPPERVMRLSRKLSGLIRRMLSVEPSERGSAAELAQALERAARAWRAARPITPLAARGLGVRVSWAGLARQARAWAPGLGVGVALAVGVWWREPRPSAEETAEVVQEERVDGQEDAGTSSLVDAVLAAPVSAELPESEQDWIGLEVPKQPLPGQRRPPCTSPQVEINGGCWGRAGDMTPPCDDEAYEWENGCYWPFLTSKRPPTSDSP